MQRLITSHYVLFIFLSVILISACSTKQAAEHVELTISAAASLTDALQEIQRAYESNHKAVKLNFNFGASGALQQQIEQGAPVDLFLAAAPGNMNALADKQLIDPNHRTTLLRNELVVVIPADANTPISRINELTNKDIRYVAIGIPDSVPAGQYAIEALMNAKFWDELQSKTVQAKDVRQVLQFVETGNADAGFVYKTDALTTQKVQVALAIDPTAYTPIEYPIGIVKATKYSKEAEQLYHYLQSKESLDVFIKYGFSVPQR